MNAIAGILRPRKGQVVMNGADVSRLPAYRVCDHGIAIVPEGGGCSAACP